MQILLGVSGFYGYYLLRTDPLNSLVSRHRERRFVQSDHSTEEAWVLFLCPSWRIVGLVRSTPLTPVQANVSAKKTAIEATSLQLEQCTYQYIDWTNNDISVHNILLAEV
jgi:hypothetical protein